MIEKNIIQIVESQGEQIFSDKAARILSHFLKITDDINRNGITEMNKNSLMQITDRCYDYINTILYNNNGGELAMSATAISINTILAAFDTVKDVENPHKLSLLDGVKTLTGVRITTSLDEMKNDRFELRVISKDFMEDYGLTTESDITISPCLIRENEELFTSVDHFNEVGSKLLTYKDSAFREKMREILPTIVYAFGLY